MYNVPPPPSPIIIISSTPATTPSITSADTIGRAKLLKQSLRLIRDKIKTEKKQGKNVTK